MRQMSLAQQAEFQRLDHVVLKVRAVEDIPDGFTCMGGVPVSKTVGGDAVVWNQRPARGCRIDGTRSVCILSQASTKRSSAN
jgi:hypothetical protein